MKIENTSSNYFFNSLYSINSTPSKDGGTYRRELNERKNKMHNLKTCEKERVKNTFVDGLLVSIELYKIKK
jgi:hypothetical protein